MLGRLRGRRGLLLITMLALIAVVAPIGIWRLTEEPPTGAQERPEVSRATVSVPGRNTPLPGWLAGEFG